MINEWLTLDFYIFTYSNKILSFKIFKKSYHPLVGLLNLHKAHKIEPDNQGTIFQAGGGSTMHHKL